MKAPVLLSVQPGMLKLAAMSTTATLVRAPEPTGILVPHVLGLQRPP